MCYICMSNRHDYEDGGLRFPQGFPLTVRLKSRVKSSRRVKLTPVDWSIIAAYFLFNLLIGFYYKSKAGSNTTEFFLSGRNVPWWLAGTSMVATTFAADTPLVVTGLVARNGIAGNWLWWNMVASGMLTVFLFSRLWRRSGMTTDIELAELRYSGKPAAFLRGFRVRLSRRGDELHHPRLGESGDGEDPDAGARAFERPGALDRDRHHRADVVHLHALRSLGRARYRSLPVRHQDDDGDRAGSRRRCARWAASMR